MKKAKTYDYFGMFSYEGHKPGEDSCSFIEARALSVFEGAKNDLFSDFDKKVIKRHSLWNRSQQVAIVRAKWDQPISTVRQLLSFCTTESLEKNKQHILDYFVKCYDWLDLAVAIKIYESIAHPEFAYVMDSISFDRHYNNNRERYSDGGSGEPYLTINMLNDLVEGDLAVFVGEYFSLIYADNLPKPKKNEATPQLLRNILARNMRFLYDMKPKEFMHLVDDIFAEYEEKGSELIRYMPDSIEDTFRNYNEQNASNDFRVFNREIEHDWFRDAIKTFELDRTRNEELYKNHYVATMLKHGTSDSPIARGTNLYMLDDQTYEFEDEKMQRFELVFNSKQSLFSLKKL